MQDNAHQQAAMRAGHHAAVYRLLCAGAAEGPPLPAGTEGAIGRAQGLYDGESEAADLLRKMNLAVFRLRQAAQAGIEEEVVAQREALSRLADAWLYQAPLFHVAALFDTEGSA